MSPRNSAKQRPSSSSAAPAAKRFGPVKYKKAPQAPRRFKSSYMFFSTTKHKEIRAELLEEEGKKLNTTEVAKMVSRAWKTLREDEREKWEDMARKDKARYEMEKSMYHGPWKVPCTKKGKDPNAPKRPMSAFLAFSNSKRSMVKRRAGDAKNAEISKILVQMWKDAEEAEKKPYIDEEYRLRQEYKIAMADWKRRSEEEREERENEAMVAIREGKVPAAAAAPSKGIRRCPSAETVETSNCIERGEWEQKYSTKMAADTFAPASAPQSLSRDYHHSYQSHPQSSYASGAATAQPVPSAYSFSSADNDYSHQHQDHSYHNPQQAQLYPPTGPYYPQSYYNSLGRQHHASATTSAYNNDSSATGYTDPRAREVYQPSTATSSGGNRDPYYDKNDYERMHNSSSGDGSSSSNTRNRAMTGYDNSYYYGQQQPSSQHHSPPPYYGYPGYDPSAAYYYQQGYYPEAAAAPVEYTDRYCEDKIPVEGDNVEARIVVNGSAKLIYERFSRTP